MKKNKRLIIMMASIIMIIAVSVAGTLAWLYTNSETVTNTFTPVKVGNYIDESFSNNVKSNVVIYNGIGSPEGEKDNLVDAYIRATYVVSWKSGNIIIPANPGTLESSAETGDYVLQINTVDWKPHSDGYYYCTRKVEPGEPTPEFITIAKALKSGPEKNVTYANQEFDFNVEIISQSIQADGVTAGGVKAVVDAWGVDPENMP